MIFVTGDIHGQLDISRLVKWKLGKKLSKKDYVIILGDFGVLWKYEQDEHEKELLKILDNLPFTTLFLSGNHENHIRVNSLIQKPMFNNKVGYVTSSVFHLLSGQAYTIDNKKLFIYGGAVSIDKGSRIPYTSWWPEEVCSEKTFSLAKQNICTQPIDYILSHTAPKSAVNWLKAKKNWYQFDITDITEECLEQFTHLCTYKHSYCGHWHVDEKVPNSKHTFVQNKFIKLK